MNSRAALIAQMARARGLDPAAVLSIASVEGGFNGSVGDHGTSFGPFQLHIGGALPKGLGNPNQWANSKAGIAYALDHIAQVAGGLKGRQAISAISSRFERPADVAGEVAKASGRYGQFTGAQGSGSSLPNALANVRMPAQLGTSGANPAAMQLLENSMLNSGNTGGLGLLQMAMQRQQAEATQAMHGVVPEGQPILVKGADPSDPFDQGAIQLAKKFLGTPYVYGGANPKTGFDCSGLLQYVWGKQGVNIPRTTYQQWAAGKSVNLNGLQPGDAVFFKGSDSEVVNGHVLPGHVAMYIGNGKVIQAPHTGADVEITPLSAMGPAMGARRFH